MPILTPPPFVQGGSHSAKNTRQFISALVGQPVETFVNSVDAVGPAHGLASAGDLAVVQADTPNMSVNVAAGRAFISGSSSLVQGAYVFTNDATTNVVIAAADASNGRRDLVCAQVRETVEDGSGQNDARLVVVAGTPAAVPVDPAIPAGCLVLARVTVAALSTSVTNANITLFTGVANRQARGVVAGGFAAKIGPQGGFSAVTDVTFQTVTFAAVAGRRYRAFVSFEVVKTVATDQWTARLDEAGTQLARAISDVSTTAAVSAVINYVTDASISGSKTWKVTLQRTGGTGTLTYQAGPTLQAILTVEDIGPL